MVHQALAGYYIPQAKPSQKPKRGPHPARTFEKLYLKFLTEAEQSIGWNDDEGRWQSAAEPGPALLEAYVDNYRHRDQRYQILATEIPFKTAVTTQQGRGRPFYYVGTIDGTWKDLEYDNLLLVDHKTTAAIRYDHLEPG